MTDIDHVHEAIQAITLRERDRLRRLFGREVADAIEAYGIEFLLRGMPTDETRQRLADVLAPRGLADPEGRAALTIPRRIGADLTAVYQLAGLRARGISLDNFHTIYEARRRESIRPITAREVAEELVRITPPRRTTWPLRVLDAARRRCPPRFGRSQPTR